MQEIFHVALEKERFAAALRCFLTFAVLRLNICLIFLHLARLCVKIWFIN